MALINCPECNYQISQKAKYCPKCGCQIKNTNQILLIIYAVIITVLAIFYFLGFIGNKYNPIQIKPKIGQERIAYNLSKDYVKKHLNYPRIVKFARLRDTKNNILELDSGRYKIESDITYEIEKGKSIKATYVCILINKGNNKWILESIQIIPDDIK